MTPFCDISNEFHFEELFKGEGNVYVDVGAYDGDTISLALKHKPLLRVVAIEPVKELANKIVNKYPDAIVIPSAASDHEGSIRLWFYSAPYEGCSTLEDYMKKAHLPNIMPPTPRNIPCARLDSLLKSHGIETVDFIKIDCEGHEEQVLAGFSLYHRGTRFHIEYHINNLANILYKLKTMNVEPYLITLSKDAVKKDVVVGYVLAVAV